MNSCVLVTGGTGFIGQHLVAALRAQGQTVRVLVRTPSGGPYTSRCLALKTLGAELVPGDLLQLPSLRAALTQATTVFHLAGRLWTPEVADAEYTRLHIEGTHNLLTACSEAGSAPKLIYCSTTGVLGPTGLTPANEDASFRPSNIYERTKAEGEKLACRMADDAGLPLAVVRPGLVYGPGDLHLLGWFRAIQRGYYHVVGRGDNLLHPIYITDLVNGMLRCAVTPATDGRVYHLVGERALPMRALAEALARALDRPLPRWHIPTLAAWVLALLFEWMPGMPPNRRPLTRGRVRFMTESRAYCGRRAREELGFVPQINLADGLQRTVAWYRSEGLL
jgi:nucleoside-diphosphate-sugar epimerase